MFIIKKLHSICMNENVDIIELSKVNPKKLLTNF